MKRRAPNGYAKANRKLSDLTRSTILWAPFISQVYFVEKEGDLEKKRAPGHRQRCCVPPEIFYDGARRKEREKKVHSANSDV